MEEEEQFRRSEITVTLHRLLIQRELVRELAVAVPEILEMVFFSDTGRVELFFAIWAHHCPSGDSRVKF